MARGQLHLLLLGTLLMPGCGGNSIRALQDDGGNDGGGAGGRAPGIVGGVGGEGAQAGNSMSARGGDAGTAIAGGTAGTGTIPAGFPRCGVLDLEHGDDCDGIDKIFPLDPRVSSLVDGSIENGLFTSVSVWVRNADEIDHDNVCVGVVVDTPGIDLEPYDDANPTTVGNMYPGGTFILTPAYFFVRDVEPGSVARFTTWTTFENTDCVGPTAVVEALVKR